MSLFRKKVVLGHSFTLIRFRLAFDLRLILLAVELANYKLQQEKVIYEDLASSLEVEKARSTELASQLSREHATNSDLQSEVTSAHNQLSKLQDSLEREQNRLVSTS